MKLSKFFKLSSFFLALLILVACNQTTDQAEEDVSNMESSGKLLANNQLIHDWQDINIQGGDLSHRFQFTNSSEDESLYLKGAQTSCMCTTAIIHLPDGETSPTYGMHNNDGMWSAEIKPGEMFEIEAIFDPMAHGPDTVGVIQRSVVLLTSDPIKPSLELKVGGDVLYEEEFEKRRQETSDQTSEPFQVLQAGELQTMLAEKDFFLLDVHIPEQEHIPGTDAFIDYRTLAENQDQLPEDKDAKIVVYCRSGSMSREAMSDLAELGYTNLYDLEGGINAFNNL